MRLVRPRILFSVLLCFLALIVTVQPAAADATFVINGLAPNNLIALQLITPTTSVFDVRGSVALDVFDPAFLGTILLMDGFELETLLGGTPAPLDFGNSILFATNLALNSATAALLNLGTPTLDASGLIVTAIGIPVVPNPTVDPALVRALGPLKFTFSLEAVQQISEDPLALLASYRFVSVSRVPEPSTVILLMTGFVGLVGAVRRKK